MIRRSLLLDRPRRKAMLVWVFSASLLAGMSLLPGCGVPGPGGDADSFGLDFKGANPSAERGVLVFLVDGVNASVFQEMLDAGELPALKEYFADRGLYAPRACANVPSVTLANLASFTTGLFPGHHEILGVNWFDRNQLIWRNYETIAQKNTLDGDYTARTIYEHFADRSTYSLFFQPHRGATKFFENWTSSGPPYFFHLYELVDRIALYRMGEMADLARVSARWPAVTVVYNLAPDFRAYQHGVLSSQYRDAIRHTDRQIGRVLGDLRRDGILDNLYIMLLSDHSLMDVDSHMHMDRFAREKLGLSLAGERLWENTDFKDRLAYYNKFPVVLYGSGDRYWALSLRKPLRDAGGRLTGFAPWTIRPDANDLARYPATGRDPSGAAAVDIPGELVKHQAVDAVAYGAGANRVRLRRGGGEVEFAQPAGPGGDISCRIVAGQDPLGWKPALPADALNGKPYPPRQWLSMTNLTDYPDLPAQLVAYFRGRRAGDLVAFAAPGWDFGNVHRAGHGGLRPGDMHVPILIAGPGITKGTLPVARTVDLAPTILRLLGRPVPPGLDGQPLVGVQGP
jgi:hypothetical protein